jgi:hypothetical protein
VSLAVGIGCHWRKNQFEINRIRFFGAAAVGFEETSKSISADRSGELQAVQRTQISAVKEQVPIMNSTSTASSKIVIAVALAAVFGTAVYIFGVHNSHQAQVAQNAAAAPVAPPPAPAPPPPDPVAQAGADPTVAAEGQVTPPSVAAATPSATPSNASTTASDTATPAPKKSDRHAKRSSDSVSDTSNSTASTAVASNTATPPPPAAAPLPAAPAAAPATDSPPVASTEAAPAATPATPDAAAPAAGANGGDSDNRITTDVKTQVAAAAPNSNVNVTTTNGVVALAGSVPSQDAANQAKQAAMRVEGVKTVDTSGLLVNNQ